MAIEEPKFALLSKDGAIELRQYAPFLIAETVVEGDMDEASNRGFRLIADFIFGNNQAAGESGSSAKIAMTAPVIAAQSGLKTEENDWYVSFVMPSGSKFGHLPHPNDPQVKLKELDAQTCVALSFRGRATLDVTKNKIDQLRSAAKRENIALSDETRICRFDPPFKPGLLHYNEIVIPAFMGER